MRRDLVILLLLLSGLRLSAQEPDSTSVVREPDNSLIGKASRLIGNASAWFQDLTPVKIFNARDTSYYSVPPGDWTIKVRSNLTGTYLSARGHSDDRNFTTRLAARHNLTHSIGVTYKGVTLGYTFSPWQRDGHDIRYDFSAYSNMAGIDATYRTISSFSGYAEADGERLASTTSSSPSPPASTSPTTSSKAPAAGLPDFPTPWTKPPSPPSAAARHSTSTPAWSPWEVVTATPGSRSGKAGRS